MKINMLTVITDYENKPVLFREDEGKEPQPMTFRKACMNAINTLEVSMKIEQKVFIYHLSIKIAKNDEVELTPEELVFIKEKVGAAYNPLIVGRMNDILGS